MAGPWEQYAAKAPAAEPAGPWAKYSAPAAPLTGDPTGSDGENLAAGVGKSAADNARGAVLRSGQALSMAPPSLPLLQALNMGMEAVGLSPKEGVKAAKADIAESRRLDKPLMNTKAGLAGNFAGNAVLAAPAGGANTVGSAGFVGGLMGLLQPALDAKESLLNTVLGWAGGAGGQAIANKVPALLQGRVDAAKAQQAANGQKFEAARTGAKEGYVVPPADLEPNMLTEALSGLSGKVKTAQVASQRNQQVTDRLARQSIGLKAGDELTADTLQNIRRQAASQGYEPIKSAGTVTADKQFFQALDDIASTQQGAARSFPGLSENGVADMVAKLKQSAFDAGDAIDATKVLREAADKAYRQGDATLGKANKAAADAIEGMLERHLQAAGQPEALQAFRDARKLIAKTYTVQKGLNGQTGQVAANKLADQLAKGKPLSDELRTVAEMATAFPKATQSLKEAPKAMSPLDFAVGAFGAGGGNPVPMAAMAARPVIRNVLLSKMAQNGALQQGTPVPFTQATQALLQNELARALLSPVGIATGVQIAQ